MDTMTLLVQNMRDHKEDTQKRFTEIKSELNSLNDKMDQLLQFKWKIIGGSIVVSGIVGMLFQVIVLILEKRN